MALSGSFVPLAKSKSVRLLLKLVARLLIGALAVIMLTGAAIVVAPDDVATGDAALCDVPIALIVAAPAPLISASDTMAPEEPKNFPAM
jgi:hypothetical protein